MLRRVWLLLSYSSSHSGSPLEPFANHLVVVLVGQVLEHKPVDAGTKRSDASVAQAEVAHGGVPTAEDLESKIVMGS